MSLAERDAIAPQMAEYERLGDSWAPYIMRFHRPLVSMRSVTTDSHGLRCSRRKDGGSYGYVEWAGDDGPKGMLLGGSTAFGVGATSDSATIASLLNGRTTRLWGNFAGRGFNSTQESIIGMLFLRPDVDRIVVMSGVNNLILAFFSTEVSPIFNALFEHGAFKIAFWEAPEQFIGVRRAAARMIRELAHRLGGITANPPPRPEIESQYANVLACVRRDLNALATLARGQSAKLVFALQPFATWIDRSPAPEESRIFEILDGLGGSWLVMKELLRRYGTQYATDVARISAEVGVPFLDLNTVQDFRRPEWLFVDRVHLTDRGYEMCANALVRGFDL